MASEYTLNRRYPLYTDNDKPNLRDQYNGAIREIDTDMAKALQDSSGVASALGAGFDAQHTVRMAIDANAQAVADEVSARTAADTALGQRVTDESTARANADNALGQRITDEVRSFDGRITNNANNISNLGEALSTESGSRAQADNALSGRIDSLGTRITDEVESIDNKINNLESDTKDAIATTYNKIPCEISRIGRLLFDTANGNAGQCTFKIGDYWYSGGQDTLCRFDQAGKMINHITDTRIGHANGGFAYDGKIYLCDGGLTKTIAVYTPITLSFERLYSFSKYTLFGICENDGVIYGYGTDTTGEYANPVIYTINLLTGEQTFLCQIENMNTKWGAAFQDMCVYDNYAYIAGTDPTIIQKIDIATGDTVCVYDMPSGDGVNPITELESLYVENGVMYITTGWYIGGVVSTYTAPIQIFETNILGPITNSPGNYEYTIARPDIQVNENAQQVFNPNQKTGQYTTIEEACILANYLNGGTIVVSNCTKGVASLKNGKFTIMRTSSAVLIDVLDIYNATVNMTFSSKYCRLFYAKAYIDASYFNELYIYNTDVKFVYCYFSELSEFLMSRSNVEMCNFVQDINTSVHSVLESGPKTTSHIKYSGGVVKGLAHLMHPMIRQMRVSVATGGAPNSFGIAQEATVSQFPQSSITVNMSSVGGSLTKVIFNTDGTVQDEYNGSIGALSNAHFIEIVGF